MKRLLAALLTFCLVLGLCSTAFAQDNTESNITVEDIAEDWIETQLSGDATVSKIVVLYSTSNEQFVGHLVSFEKDAKPAGYIVLSHEEGAYPIIEFALEGPSIYQYIEDQFNSYKDNTASTYQDSISSMSLSAYSIVDENVLYTDFINYSLKIQDNDEALLFNQYKQVETCSELTHLNTEAPTSDTFYDDYIELPSESGSKTVVSITGANKIQALVMENMPGASSGEGNCGPTSLANTVKLYAEYKLNGNSSVLSNLKVNHSDNDTYSRLVEISGYSSTKPASMSTLVSAIKSYAIERGYSCSTSNYLLDLWSDFTGDIGNDRPVLLYTSSSAGTAHAQVVVGYWLYNSGSKYLKILSGWTSYPTFVKFKPSSLNHFNGYGISIS